MNNILIVEDNENLAQVLSKRLKKNGYTVLSAGDGKQALELLSESEVDIILSDIMMPNMNGFDFRNHLLENENTRDIPFIFLTAKDSLSDKVKGYKQLADGYLTKTFEFDELIAKIDAVRDKRELTKSEILTAIKRLAVSISHEVNNPLNVIKGHTQHLLGNLDTLNNPSRKKLNVIKNRCPVLKKL